MHTAQASSHKLPTRSFTLPPTPPLSPVSSEGSYAESLDDLSSLASLSSSSASTRSTSPAARYHTPLSSTWTVPPPGAQVFQQRVHRYPPRPFTRRERAKHWYGGLLFEVLEPWESVVVLAFLLLLFFLTYLAASRLFAPAHLARLSERLRWYLTGVASKATTTNTGSPDAGGLVAKR